jgi:O-antigen/teichoic acid export membrane protein
MNRDARNSESSQRGDTISRNAAFAFAAQMSTVAFTAVLTVFLTRQLGPAGYGTFALAIGITGVVLRPAAGGTSQAAARFIAERHGDTKAITGVLGMALRTRLLTASAIAVVLFVLAGPISDLYNAPELAWPLRGAAVAFFGQSLMNFSRSAFTALRRTSRTFGLVISESAMEFTASVVLVLLGGGATGAAFGRAVGYVFGAVFGMFLIARLLGRSPFFRTGQSPVARREFMGYAGTMLVVTGAGSLFSYLDTLLIGAFLSTAAVGVYSAPLRLLLPVGYPALALAQGVAPRMARHPDEPPRVAALERAIGYIVILQAGVVTLLALWADPIVRLLLGSEFSESAEVIRALTPFVLLTSISSLLTAPLNYAGEGRRRIPIVIAAVAVNAAIDVVLIPEIGVVGAAIGTDVAYVVYAGAHLWLCHRLLGLRLKPLAATGARALVAAGVMAGVLALVGTESLSALDWLVGLPAAGVAFVAALLAVRALSPGEIRTLVRLPAKALRGR